MEQRGVSGVMVDHAVDEHGHWKAKEMDWQTAVHVIEWCVDEMLDKIAEWPNDYGPGRAEEVSAAFDRILKGQNDG